MTLGTLLSGEMQVWYLVFKVVALTHMGGEMAMAEFNTEARCLAAVVALHAGHPLVPYVGWGVGREQPESDFLFCADRAESGG